MSLESSLNNIHLDHINDPIAGQKQVNISVARLDKIHPVISGNKLFKLWYFLQHARKIKNAKLLTYGGAYSNHLVATAYAAREFGVACKGIVRGEKPVKLSHTLQSCLEYGMKLEFVSRAIYKTRSAAATSLPANIIHIPEGGYHPDGAKGASLIMDQLPPATYYCVSAGTATTLAGLLMGSNSDNKIIVFPALKGITDISSRIKYLTGHTYNNIHIDDRFHFGGYAKHSPELIEFMNDFYNKHGIPLDFVYTGKMMIGVLQLLKENFFTPGSNMICLHTGGLQGNFSLPAGTLGYV